MSFDKIYQYNFPTTIRFGAGASKELGDYLVKNNLSSPLIVTDSTVSQLDFFKATPHNHVFADIVGRAGDSYSSIFIINKGSQDGIRDNLAVVTDNGIIIGKTASVRETTSQVVLLNDRTSKLLAMVPNKKESTGIIEGQFGLGITMGLLPITGDIAKDDAVVTAGLEDGIPPGLVIGAIAGVQFQQGDLFKTAQVKSSVNYDSVRIVSVLLP